MDFISVIKAYLNKEVINEEMNSDLLKLFIDQSLQTLIYPTTQNKLYKKYYISWIIKQESFFSLQEEITKIFNENSIKHMYFKGSILSKMYDDQSVRTRGDIDLYIDGKELKHADKVLKGNGFIQENGIQDSLHHICYTKNDITVEVHFAMFEPGNNQKWIKTFKNVFALCEPVKEYLVKLNDTYHFLYVLMHQGHHLRTGAGFRYILDFYYMFKKTEIDLELLHSLLKINELEILYANNINVLRTLTEDEFDISIPDKDVSFYVDYMLSYGIHGHANGNETDSRTAARENKVRYFFFRVFLLNKNHRITRFPHIGKFIVLYPICLLVHWCYLLTHKFDSFFKFLFGKNKNKELYKKLGV